jgi:Ca2+-binding RTX toxin-like protein
MGFSVSSSGNGWTESFNWKPTKATGNFQTTISEFMQAYKKGEPNKVDYSRTEGYIQSMLWKGDGFVDGAVQLGSDGGTFSGQANANALYNIFGGSGADNITGGNIGDFIQGGNGKDKLYGEGGNDELWGGGGDDMIYGGAGLDVLYGNEGNDTLDGGDGNDLLLGDEGNDTLTGGAGDDVVFGGQGNDKMTGGLGADKFYLSELSGTGTKITDFSIAEEDTIHIIDMGSDFKAAVVNNGQIELRTTNGTLGYTVREANGAFIIEKPGTGGTKITMATVSKKEGETISLEQFAQKLTAGKSEYYGYADTTPKGGKHTWKPNP